MAKLKKTNTTKAKQQPLPTTTEYADISRFINDIKDGKRPKLQTFPQIISVLEIVAAEVLRGEIPEKAGKTVSALLRTALGSLESRERLKIYQEERKERRSHSNADEPIIIASNPFPSQEKAS